MNLKQIFGWTEPKCPQPPEMVTFISVSAIDDTDMRFSIRTRDGKWGQIDMPNDNALELALTVVLHFRNVDRAEANLPPLTMMDLAA